MMRNLTVKSVRVKKAALIALVSVFAAILFFNTGNIGKVSADTSVSTFAGGITLDIDYNKQGHDLPDTLYGVFLEDINYALDGGLNAEMIFNPSFEYQYRKQSGDRIVPANDKKTYGWTTLNTSSGKLSIGGGANAMSELNENALKVTATASGYGIKNQGHREVSNGNSGDPIYSPNNGMAVRNGGKYSFSFYAKNLSFNGIITARLVNQNGTAVSDTIEILPDSKEFTQYSGIITAGDTARGALEIYFEGTGEIYLDYISLIDAKSWGFEDPRYTGGKLRRDFVEALDGLNPSFLRFPGGCLVEGAWDWNNVYEWKGTIGPLTERQTKFNMWDYYQSYGVGFYEFFLLAEDIDALPLPVVHSGILCQSRSNGHESNIYADSPYFKSEVVDNILHLIYWAKGNASSNDAVEKEWAKKRADAGHPAAFELKHIGVGNENFGKKYLDNFLAAKAALENYDGVNILEKFGITLITSSGMFSGSPKRPDNDAAAAFDYAWGRINTESEFNDTLVDEHFYNSTEWFFGNSDRYDNYKRDAAKVFVGEYATLGNALNNALSEAAFLTGVEKNADVIEMACYAPLFAKVNATQWGTDLMFFNPYELMKTPSYYVQQMYGQNKGNKLINSTLSGATGTRITAADAIGNSGSFTKYDIYQSVSIDTAKKEIYVKLTNSGSADKPVAINFSNFGAIRSLVKVTSMNNTNRDAVNSLSVNGTPVYNVKPAETTLNISGGELNYTVKGYSVNVLKLSYGDTGTDSTLSNIKMFGRGIEGFSKDKTDYTVKVPDTYKEIPALKVYLSDINSSAVISYADSFAGTTTVAVTAENGSTTQYKIKYELVKDYFGTGTTTGGGKTGGCSKNNGGIIFISLMMAGMLAAKKLFAGI